MINKLVSYVNKKKAYKNAIKERREILSEMGHMYCTRRYIRLGLCTDICMAQVEAYECELLDRLSKVQCIIREAI